MADRLAPAWRLRMSRLDTAGIAVGSTFLVRFATR